MCAAERCPARCIQRSVSAYVSATGLVVYLMLYRIYGYL